MAPSLALTLSLFMPALSIAAALDKPSADTLLAKRITGGTPAVLGQFPSIVSLSQNGVYICGGTLISESYVLTASHCFANDEGKGYSVRAGSLKHAEGGYTSEVETIKLHDKWDPDTVQNDIALLRLVTPIPKSLPSVDFITLPKAGSDPVVGTPAQAAGWGATEEETYGDSPILLFVDQSITDRQECDKLYSALDPPDHITNEQLCAGSQVAGKGTCNRDGGGPLYQNGTQVGIISFGQGCGNPKYPGVYTRLSEYTDWIKKNTQ